jgi:hypothetical protein
VWQLVPDPPGEETFVAQLYQDLLGRAPDPSGLAFWSGLLAQHVTRVQVTMAIESSVEYHAHVVDQLYLRFLARTADGNGLAAFTAFLNAGGTLEQVETAILTSPEYFQHTGGTTEGFLNGLYRDLLGRSVDPVAATLWDVALQTNLSRASLVSFIQASPEAGMDRVEGYYQTYLHRVADAGGLMAFTTAMRLGAPDEGVVAALASSDEYYARLG